MSEPSSAADAGEGLLGAATERAAYSGLLRNARFRNLFLAMLTSSLGDWLGLFAILALTESLLGPTRAGAFALSGIMVARVLPTLALGPVAGVFVDRWDRKRTLIVTDIGRGVIMVLVAFVGDIFQLVVATFLIEVMSTLFIPAKDATLPNLVQRNRLVQANQLSLMVTYGTLPLGAGLFAALVAISDAVFGDIAFFGDRSSAVPILLNALTFFVSAVFIARIDIPRERAPRAVTEAGDQPGAWTELKEGLRFITSHAMVRALVVGVMGAFLAAGVVASGVGKLFATILNAGDSGFGVLGAVVGAGLFVGLLGAGPASQRIDKERLFAPALGVAGAALVVTALMPRLDLAALPAFVMGVGTGVSFVTGYTMLQEHSSDEIRGRTFAAFNTGVRAALFATLVVGPFLVGLIGVESPDPATEVYGYQIGGVRTTLILGGIVAFVGAVWTGRSIHQVLTDRADLTLELRAEDRPRRHGVFVAFEGGDGSGKSTQVRLLRAAIERTGRDVVVTREPGSTEVGERIRDLLLDPGATIGPRTEALLYAAARAELAEQVIRPALEKGAVVLSDRYVDSSIVYQGVGRDLGELQIEELNRWGTDDLQPDLVVLLDIPSEEGLRRAGSAPDRLEAAGVAFHQAVNEAFRRRAAVDPTAYLVLDATEPAEKIHAEVRDRVLKLLGAPATDATTHHDHDDLGRARQPAEDAS